MMWVRRCEHPDFPRWEERVFRDRRDEEQEHGEEADL